MLSHATSDFMPLPPATFAERVTYNAHATVHVPHGYIQISAYLSWFHQSAVHSESLSDMNINITYYRFAHAQLANYTLLMSEYTVQFQRNEISSYAPPRLNEWWATMSSSSWPSPFISFGGFREAEPSLEYCRLTHHDDRLIFSDTISEFTDLAHH